MGVFTSTSKLIQLDSTALGGVPGGEGTVFRIIDNSTYRNHCVKLYHPTKLNDLKIKKLDFLISNRPTNFQGEHYTFCWPVEKVYDSKNKFCGFIMPLATTGSVKLSEFINPSISKKLGSTWGKIDRNTSGNFIKRLGICLNLAIAVHNLHHLGKFVMYDFKPQNILIDVHGNVSIIDIDSFQISGNNNFFRAEVVTQEYAPMEYHKSTNPSNFTANKDWDRFSLAVIFYQILTGVHPYAASCKSSFANISTTPESIKHGLFVHGPNKIHLSVIPPPHNMFNNIPSKFQTLFQRAFQNFVGGLIERPSAEEWGKTLYEEIQRNANPVRVNAY